jgi:hypothetical protein
MISAAGNIYPDNSLRYVTFVLISLRTIFKVCPSKKLLAPCPPHNFCQGEFVANSSSSDSILIITISPKFNSSSICFRFYGRILREPSSRNTGRTSSSSGSPLPRGTSGSTSSVPLAVSNSRYPMFQTDLCPMMGNVPSD